MVWWYSGIVLGSSSSLGSVFERSFFTVQLCWGDFNLGQRRIKVFCITLPRKLRSFLSSSFLLESVLKKSSSNWFDSHVQIFFEFSANWKTLWGNLLDPNSVRSCTILTNYYKNIGLSDDVNLYYFFQYKVYYIWYVLVVLLCYTSTSPTDFLFSSTEGLNRMNSEEVWNRDRC